MPFSFIFATAYHKVIGYNALTSNNFSKVIDSHSVTYSEANSQSSSDMTG